MIAFSVVKKIGEGKYLAEDFFILERVRKKSALKTDRMRFGRDRFKAKTSAKNERFNLS